MSTRPVPQPSRRRGACHLPVRYRLRLLERLVALALVLWGAMLLGAEPASAQQAGVPQPLLPGQGDLVTGTTTLSVFLPRMQAPGGPFVRQVAFFDAYNDGQADQRTFIGFDAVGIGAGEGPFCLDPEGCFVDGIWSLVWEPPAGLPTGAHRIDVAVEVCPPPDANQQQCQIEQADGLFEVFVDLTPPSVAITGPSNGAEVPVGDPVELVAEADPTGEALEVRWTFQPYSFLAGKGLPLKDQHVDGETLSGDNNGDTVAGDSSCAPTAAGSSLAWFAEQPGFGAILPEGATAAERNKALVERLGELAGTDDNGTMADQLKDAIEDYLEEVGLGDDFDVELDEDPTVGEMADESGRGQDVLIGIFGDGFGHRVAIDSITENDDGTTTIQIMDPWSGAIETITVSAEGQASYDPPWTEAEDPVDVNLDRMIHVSPTADGDEVPIPDAGPILAAAAAPGDAITWDTSGVPAGTYLLRATGVDANGTEQSDFSTVVLTGGPDVVSRLSGSGRVQTAVAVSQDAFDSGTAGAAVLARADLFPDALAGTPLAELLGGPLLLTAQDALSPDTADELVRALPDGATVFLLGGTAALSEDVATAVEALGLVVERYGGADRFATAVAIAEEGLGSPATVLLTTGGDFPDALGAGVAAAALDGAVLLTSGSTMPAVTRAYLDAIASPTLFAVGGPASAAAPDAEALVGATRFETAVAVAERFFAAPASVGIATGTDFPDALAGGAHIANAGGPMLLSAGSELPAAVETYLTSHSDTIAAAYLFGGPAALSDGVRTAVEAAIG